MHTNFVESAHRFSVQNRINEPRHSMFNLKQQAKYEVSLKIVKFVVTVYTMKLNKQTLFHWLTVICLGGLVSSCSSCLKFEHPIFSGTDKM